MWLHARLDAGESRAFEALLCNVGSGINGGDLESAQTTPGESGQSHYRHGVPCWYSPDPKRVVFGSRDEQILIPAERDAAYRACMPFELHLLSGERYVEQLDLWAPAKPCRMLSAWAEDSSIGGQVSAFPGYCGLV